MTNTVYRMDVEDVAKLVLERDLRIKELSTRICELQVALRDLVLMERTVAPDMSGKRRKFAYMRNGDVLADCLDRARELLGKTI